MGKLKHQAVADSERRRRAIRLGDLGEPGEPGVDVFCWCNRCGHNAVLALAPLVAELGPAFPVPELGGRLRCSGCGTKDVAARPHWPSLGTVAHHGGSRKPGAED